MKKIIWIVMLAFISISMSLKAEAMYYHPQSYLSEIKQVKSETLPVKQWHSAKSKTVFTLKKNDTVFVYPGITAGWASVQGGYVNNSLLTARVAYGSTIIYPPHIQKLTADNVVKDSYGNIMTSFKKGDLVENYASHGETQSWIGGLNLQQKNGYVPTQYLQDIPPTIRSTNNKGGVLLREKPSPSAKVIGTLAQKVAVESYGQVAGGWRVVTYGGAVGYVPASTMVAVQPTIRYVAAEGLTVYEKASRSAKTNYTLEQGVQVQAYEAIGGWSYVRLGSVSGYVPTQFLVAKKPAVIESPVFPGLKMDLRVIKQHITKTNIMHDKGKKLYIHTSRFGLGVQQTGSNAVYFQIRAGNEQTNKVAEQLTNDTGAFFIGCERVAICQYINGELQQVVSAGDPTTLTPMYMKRISKGVLQVAYKQSDEYEHISFATYRYDDKSKTVIFVEGKYYSEHENWGEAKTHFERFQAEPNYFVKYE